MDPILSIQNLKVWFPVRMGYIAAFAGKQAKHVRAVDGISLEVRRGEVFCLVGESGCGKTTTGKALLRLNDPTEGGILFNLPPEEWERLRAVQAKLHALGPIEARLTRPDRAAVERAWRQLQRMKTALERAENPTLRERQVRTKERLERSRAILEERLRALGKGEDATVRRVLKKDHAAIENLRTKGPWFTPSRIRKMDRLKKDLEEARYRLFRAEVTHGSTSRPRRRVARLERRSERYSKNIRKDDPALGRKVQALERAFEVKARQLVDIERAHVMEELGRVGQALATLQSGQPRTDPAEADRLQRAIEAFRTRGGPALHAQELRAEEQTILDRYDLARWSPKRRGRRGRSTLSRRSLKAHLRELRKRVQIIYQDPYESLNPKLSIFDIVAEPLLANKLAATPSEAEAVVAKAVEDVGLKPAHEFLFRYPHELSGGQRQRVGIASALVVDPDFIVADEPVSMLDASVRTEILALLLELKKRRNLTYLFITHDLGLAWILADRLAVMYLGKIVEMGDGPEIIQNPRHPYTKALISVVPSPNPDVRREKIILRGERPNPIDIPTGCRFHPRCPMAVGICGWDANEVRDELTRLVKEEGDDYPEARSMGPISVDGPFSLSIETGDPQGIERYLRSRMPALGPSRPALGSIRKMEPDGRALRLTLHVPTEPPLRQIRENVWVGCHLVEPELGGAEAAATEPAATLEGATS